jgi:hypothetical protein
VPVDATGRVNPVPLELDRLLGGRAETPIRPRERDDGADALRLDPGRGAVVGRATASGERQQRSTQQERYREP